jgi:hemerythrin-like domain-containing protein
MPATAELRREHQDVCLVVNAADRQASTIRETRRVDADWIRDFVEFSRAFTDGCHHSKEERHLFPLLQERAPELTRGPVGVMLAEHDGGRERIRRLLACLEQAEAGDAAAVATAAEQLAAYSQLLRSHIAKENNVLFPLADRVLTDEDQVALDAAFERVEHEETGAGEHERLHSLAERLAGDVKDARCDQWSCPGFVDT